METIYIHDLSSEVGDTFEIHGIRFTKILTNPAFHDPRLYQWYKMDKLNTGEAVRVYNDTNPFWDGSHFMWNSVYLIEH